MGEVGKRARRLSFLTAFFYGTAPWDAWVYTSAFLLLGLLCVVAAVVAAARVARLEPMRVLNEQ